MLASARGAPKAHSASYLASFLKEHAFSKQNIFLSLFQKSAKVQQGQVDLCA